MWYFIEYNGKCVGAYKRLRTARKRIAERGLVDDEANLLRLTDSNGVEYDVTPQKQGSKCVYQATCQYYKFGI